MPTGVYSVKVKWNSGLTHWSRYIASMSYQMPQTMAKILRTSAMHVLVPRIRKRIKKNQSIFTGDYHSRMTVKGGVNNTSGPFVDIGAFGVPYGLNLEQGAPAHKPDYARIVEYVRRKMGMSGSAGVSQALAIIMVLQTKGSKAHPSILPVWRANSDKFFDDVVRRIGAALLKASKTGVTPP